jgi:hypothetical protein
MTAPDRDSYYGRPILKQPIWKPEVGAYLFMGGLAGASSTLALAAQITRNRPLARTATLVAGAAVNVCPPLLIKDLGRPERFLNMLRVFKPTSPMSVGSWILATAGSLQSVATACELFGVMPRTKLAAQVGSGLLGPPLATYTAALLSDTAVPVWHEARREMPPLFAASSCASAGAAAVLLGPADATRAARRLALLGGCAELVAAIAMERRLGELGEPYHSGAAGRLARASKGTTAAGLLALTRRRGLVSRAGSALVLAGAALERFSVFRAGNASAIDPKYTVDPQRRRLEQRAARARIDGRRDGGDGAPTGEAGLRTPR